MDFVSSLERITSKPAKVCYLFRHPDKKGDAEGIYLGNDARITDYGRSQVPLTVAQLKLLHTEVILSSKLPRSIELGQVMADAMGLPLIQNELFNEIDKPQSLVGLKRLDPRHAETMRQVRELFDDDRVPEGVAVKSRSEIEFETRRGFDLIESLPYEFVAIVGHAKRIASYVHFVQTGCKTLRGFYDMDAALKLDTASITTLVLEPDRRTGEPVWKVQSVNDTWHLRVGAELEFQRILASLDAKAPVSA